MPVSQTNLWVKMEEIEGIGASWGSKKKEWKVSISNSNIFPLFSNLHIKEMLKGRRVPKKYNLPAETFFSSILPEETEETKKH